ncbi:MAG: SpoIIE family protein phosphatase [Bacteroidales bacterium]|nr:SpoIIE family protein phosphatase [Bacteroidales bacterium]
MDQKLLLINIEDQSAERINSILKKEFPLLNINAPINSDIVPDCIDKILPDIVLFDFDISENQIQKNIDLLEYITKNKKLPVIALSSSKNYNALFKAGAINFIHKPFKDVTLISNINTAFNLKGIINSIRIKEKVIDEKNQKIQFQVENELKQREMITRKNKEIMADIRYASRIQHAILPQLDFIEKFFHDYFILHQPKRHVSGDFYWVSCQGNKKIIAVGDCTGHGISGALMHMLGSAFLKEIIVGNNFSTASDILEQLRDHIMQSLNQTGETGEAQDGLDISLCIIDCENNKLQFSGANNPVYIIKNNELTEIKGDRMPVGIHINFNKPFTNHNIDLEPNDQIYLFSDGYADQFGGPHGKKFRYKQFKELLVKVSHEPMNIQKEILNNVHDNWRGEAEQIDDILVFGLKIK